MILKSSYLGIDIEVSDGKIESGGEEVTIIPHDTLEDIILNADAVKPKNIAVHYICVINEPGHYAFLCSISDTDGRRIEKLGESTDNTLNTAIAKNYPATMAFKRSFDAAAIKYLGLPSKVYSDLQIESRNEHSEKTGRTFGAPPVETDGKPKPKNQPPADKAPGVTSAENSDTKEDSADAAKPKSADSDKSMATVSDGAPSKNAKKSHYTAPPLAAEEDLVDEGDSSQPEDQKTAPNPTTGKKRSAGYTAPPMEEEIDKDTGSNGDVADEFDTTILKCGQLRRQNLSIRAAYALNPGSVRWVAEEMIADTDFKKAQQDVCRRFLSVQSAGDCAE